MREFTVPPPACIFGYTDDQVRDVTGDLYGEFVHWFAGQTGVLCDGQPPCREPHGPVVYRHDLAKFLRSVCCAEWTDANTLRVVRERARDN